MATLLLLEDESTVLTVRRNQAEGKPVLHFFVQGDFDSDATGVEFSLPSTSAYHLGQSLAQDLENDPEDDGPILLRLSEDAGPEAVEFTLTAQMAKRFSRALIQKLGN